MRTIREIDFISLLGVLGNRLEGLTYVAAKQLETSIEVGGTVYEPLISIHDDNYTIIIHEGSYYMIIDCTSPELQTTVYKPTLH